MSLVISITVSVTTTTRPTIHTSLHSNVVSERPTASSRIRCVVCSFHRLELLSYQTTLGASKTPTGSNWLMGMKLKTCTLWILVASRQPWDAKFVEIEHRHDTFPPATPLLLRDPHDVRKRWPWWYTPRPQQCAGCVVSPKPKGRRWFNCSWDALGQMPCSNIFLTLWRWEAVRW